MSNLLIVLAACADDAPLAERILDFIFHLNGKQKRGHILLSMASDVHDEMSVKLSISADLAFEGFTKFKAKPSQKGIQATKTENINDLFQQTAHFISTRFRWPWLWLEPDCVPLRPDWMNTLATAYASQPKKYVGRGMKRKEGATDHFFLARTAIYPAGAWNELRLFNSDKPMEWDASTHVVPRATKTKLIQQGRFEGDISVINPEAVLFHSEKTGSLMEHLRESKPEPIAVKVMDTITEKNLIKAEIENHRQCADGLEALSTLTSNSDPEPPDKRTKAWKEWSSRNLEARGT